METKNESVSNVTLPKGDEANTMGTNAKDNKQVKKVDVANFNKNESSWEEKEPYRTRYDDFVLMVVSLVCTWFLLCFTKIKDWVCIHFYCDAATAPQPNRHILTNKYIFFLVVFFVVFALSNLIIYYFYKRVRDSKKYQFKCYKIGEDLSKILSWFFSANGLLFILAITIVSLIVFIMCNFDSLAKSEGKGDLQLIAITITISLSAIIPAVISKILARGEIVSIIEDKLKQELKEYDISLYNLRRDKAHASRMSAVFLFQLASQQKELALGKDSESINKDNLQLALKNATWSVGWASVAVSQYILVRDQEPEADTLCKELMNEYFSKYENLITECLESYDNDKEIFRSRDFTSLVIMHALIKHFRYLKSYEETISKLEKLFVKENPDNLHIDIDCSVLGLGKESKEELTKLTKRIVAHLRAEELTS